MYTSTSFLLWQSSGSFVFLPKQETCLLSLYLRSIWKRQEIKKEPVNLREASEKLYVGNKEKEHQFYASGTVYLFHSSVSFEKPRVKNRRMLI